VKAHTLGEVGVLGTVLLRVYSGTMLPIFIEIGSYLTDKEQKISWHSFLRHGVHVSVSICTCHKKLALPSGADDGVSDVTALTAAAASQ